MIASKNEACTLNTDLVTIDLKETTAYKVFLPDQENVHHFEV